MSRIGKRIIPIPQGVDVKHDNGDVHVKGPKGENRYRLPELVALEIGEGEMRLVADYVNDADARRVMGTANAVLTNMVTGVSAGFTKRLQLVGVGYRAQLQGQQLEMTLGFSHPVRVTLPEAVSAEVEGTNQVVLSCHDNVLLGQVAAGIRALRPPEPYQGKGISYAGERIRRKAGKTGKK